MTVVLAWLCLGAAGPARGQSPGPNRVPTVDAEQQTVHGLAGQRLYPLFFDSGGADFRQWITHFTSEVYRNWIMPKGAEDGESRTVDIEFIVERDGSMSRCRIFNSSTIPALDEAAKAALESSRFLPLPEDYGPSRTTIKVSFHYNEQPTTEARLTEKAHPLLPGTLPAKAPEQAPLPPDISHSSSLRKMESRLHTGRLESQQEIHGLIFDPMGADFSRWVTQFTRETYRNWTMPQPAREGVRGHAEIEFRVERDGTLSQCRIRKSSKNAEMDRATLLAVESSHFLALPDDYGPSHVTMRATFFYNELPQGQD